ncbi:MAG: glycoside hydrolase family 3 N-terminal domain-containing protein, partial [Chloroflexota bacterium]
PAPQQQAPLDQAAALLAGMTPEERVGQLFLVTFSGSQLTEDLPVYTLIQQHHLGGVALLAQNDNLASGETADATPRQLNALVRQLQQAEWNASQPPADGQGAAAPSSYVPLFIALSQEGGGYPYDQVLQGLTPLPNQMALGATWNPDLATQVGDTLGREMAALGVNLLLGPSLDVLETPQLDTASNLGTRTFGGDPYWVGLMGQAYIRGVHSGSSGRVAVAARHFPGHGSSDRLPEEEVATVRKSLDELVAFDLAPFFAATGNAPSPAETADALVASHIRYQGLQGNIRATTRPVSFDPQALGLLLGLPQLTGWHTGGGIVISDDLGNRAVRRFYELTSQTFDARRVALNAFLAGNDLLYVADFSSQAEPDSSIEAVRTLEFFTQKYREDAAFAQRVDSSALRILTLKLRLYGSFDPQQVLPDEARLAELGQGSQVTFEVARRAATLLSPTQAELDTLIPDPPNQNDRIVFVSDTLAARQCSSCPELPQLGAADLQTAILRLYGPQAGGQVTPNSLSSYTLDDLQALLNAPGGAPALEGDLQRANWVVVSMLNQDAGRTSYATLKQFLISRPDLFQQKRLIVFAFSAPYYLDATDVSKLTAYYALYSRSPQSVDVAAYLLFGELRAAGSPPVSVPGIGYNLNAALFPNPAQVIALDLDLPAAPLPGAPGAGTPQPAAPPGFSTGDVVPLRTGTIVDFNGNPVPDGTPVQFIISYGNEASSTRQTEVTRGGVARTTYLVPSPGSLEIYAESENARSNLLRIDIPAAGEAAGEVETDLPPTPAPETPTPQPTQPPAQSTPIIVVITPVPPTPQPRPDISDWLIAVLTAGLLAFGAFRLSVMAGQVRWGVRAGFLALIGGVAAYSYIALKLPGSPALTGDSAALRVFLVTAVGTVLGMGGAGLWKLITERGFPRSLSDITGENRPLTDQSNRKAKQQQPGGDPDQRPLDR